MTDLDPDRPIEDDPTGMRALLASLPDQEARMPEDVAARLDARLRAELGDRHPGPVGAGPQTVAIDVPHRRRGRLRRALAGAAAAALLLPAGGVLLAQTLGTDQSVGSAAPDAVAGSDTATRPGSTRPTGSTSSRGLVPLIADPGSPAFDGPQVPVAAAPRALRPRDLRGDVAGLVRGARPAPAGRPRLSEDRALACLDPIAGVDGAFLGRGRIRAAIGGTGADRTVVLLARDASGEGRAVLVDEGCDLLAGPVDVPPPAR